MRCIEKWKVTVNANRIGTTCSITMQSLERSNYARRLRCENIVFFVCHVWSACACIVWTSIVSWFMGQFWCCFHVVFENDCPFSCIIECLFLLPGGATIFAKLRSKISKTLKIDGKVCAHNFV